MNAILHFLVLIGVLFVAYISDSRCSVAAEAVGSVDGTLHPEGHADDPAAATNDHNAEAVARMTRLRALLEDGAFVGRVDDLLIECLSTDTTHTAEFCDDVRYVDGVRAALRSVTTKPSSSQETVPEVSLQTSATYPNLFRNFMMTNKPFKAPLDKPVIASEQDGPQRGDFDASAALAACIRELGLKVGDEMKDVPYRLCSQHKPEYFEGARIPRVASNNYMFRLASASPSPSAQLESVGLVDYTTHWPSLLPLYDVFPAVHSCPSSMHMLVWGAPASVNVNVRIIHRNSSFALKPALGKTVPHYIAFAGSGFPAAQDAQLLSGSYRDTVLGPDEYLFIPHDYVASFVTPTGPDSVALSKMCFVDASNLKDFRASIAPEAVVSARSREMIDAIDAISFDIALSRDPRALEFAWLSERVRDARTATLAASDVSVASTPAQPNLDNPAPRDRKNKGSALRDLNDAAQWASLATSLTLPVPGMPRFKHVGWRNATIEWETKYKPDRNDKTKFGFDLEICKASSRDECFKDVIEKTSLKVRTQDVLGRPVHTFSTHFSKFVEPDTSYLVRVTIFHGDAHGKPSQWSQVAHSLRLREPLTVTGPVVATVLPVDPLSSIKELPLAVELRFAPPADDGGMPITGYAVYGKQHGPAAYKGLIRIGVFTASLNTEQVVIVVSGVLAGVVTEFYVAAVNEVGVAMPSLLPSNRIEPTMPSAFKSIVRGMLDNNFALTPGTPAFPLTVPAGHKSGDAEWFPGSRYLRLRARDQALDLVENTPDQGKVVLMSVEAWSSHWNPAGISFVEAQAAWMVPTHGDGPSAHEIMERREEHDPEIAALVNRIAVVQRGVVPFAKKIRKAQGLGALGVVIVDDGTCGHGAFDQLCVPGADKSRDEKFAALDYPEAWNFMRIPALLVHAHDWSQLLERWALSPAEAARMKAAEAARLERQQQEQNMAAAGSGEL